MTALVPPVVEFFQIISVNIREVQRYYTTLPLKMAQKLMSTPSQPHFKWKSAIDVRNRDVQSQDRDKTKTLSPKTETTETLAKLFWDETCTGMAMSREWGRPRMQPSYHCCTSAPYWHKIYDKNTFKTAITATITATIPFMHACCRWNLDKYEVLQSNQLCILQMVSSFAVNLFPEFLVHT